MNDFNYLKEGYVAKNAFQSVFVMIYSRRKEKIAKTITREIPGLLAIFRSDGRLGFPGGRMESKDLVDKKVCSQSLRNTAVREVREEIGYDILCPQNLKFESSTLIGKNQITTFSYLVSDDELNKIYKDYSNSIGTKFNDDELFGLMRFYFRENNTRNIFRQNFKTTTKSEINSLLKKYF